MANNPYVNKVKFGDQTVLDLSGDTLNTASQLKKGITAHNKAGAPITGTFTDPSTVSTGQTAAAAGQIVSGYSAWVNGSEVQGSIPVRGSNDITIAGDSVIVPNGYYSGIEKEFPSIVPGFEGGEISGNNTLTGDSCSISTSSNNSGVSISAECLVTRADVTYDDDYSGIISQEDGETALESETDTVNSAAYYINGVTLTAPDVGSPNRTFSVTVPNGDSTVTFVFNIDSDGNVVISES